MPHVRRSIREAAAMAVTGLATTGAHVFQSRVYSLKDADLPCLLVTSLAEDTVNASIDTMLLDRALQLRIRGVHKATVDLDDALDQIALEVEQALLGSTLGGKCKPLVLVSTRIDMDDTLDKPAGVIELIFSTNYFTVGNDPATPV